MVFGGIGGAVVEIIALWGRLNAWQAARSSVRRGGAGNVPSFSTFVDPLPDVAVALTRVALGALAGLIFHDQIAGATVAVAAGAAGPALLAQFGTVASFRRMERDA